jgi:hypothetical protein
MKIIKEKGGLFQHKIGLFYYIELKLLTFYLGRNRIYIFF